MAWNCYGDITKGDIVIRLRERGCNIKNVHELNIILEEMGLVRRSGNCWMTTDKGVPYTIYNSRSNADVWHPSIVDEVYNYIC